MSHENDIKSLQDKATYWQQRCENSEKLLKTLKKDGSLNWFQPHYHPFNGSSATAGCYVALYDNDSRVRPVS